MQLVSRTDPILTTSCAELDFADPPFDPVEFSRELVALMYERGGIGLAAPQVGVPHRAFAMRGSPENFVCFNPRVVTYPAQETQVLEEACLSFPGLIVKVKRPIAVKVRFQLPNGDTQTHLFGGMTARVFQHELDHLDGVLFFKKASKYHRDQGFRRWLNKGFDKAAGEGTIAKRVGAAAEERA